MQRTVFSVTSGTAQSYYSGSHEELRRQHLKNRMKTNSSLYGHKHRKQSSSVWIQTTTPRKQKRDKKRSPPRHADNAISSSESQLSSSFVRLFSLSLDALASRFHACFHLCRKRAFTKKNETTTTTPGIDGEYSRRGMVR